MGNSPPAEQKSLRTHVQTAGRRAVIMGPTGATGKFILAYFIRSAEWSKVTIIHRREVNLDEISQKTNVTFTDRQKAKVTQHVVDMEKLCENEETINKNVELFKENDITICALGTTRAIAKSADNFRKVDLYMVRDGGILSKKAGVKMFSLLTSKGASANFWTNDWKISHGLLYLKTKGDAENSIIEQKFMKTSVFRPGLLNRTGDGSGLDVRDLAACMVYDLECDWDESKEEQKAENAIIYESSDINNMVLLARDNYNQSCDDKSVENKGGNAQEKKEDLVTENKDIKVEEKTEVKSAENAEIKSDEKADVNAEVVSDKNEQVLKDATGDKAEAEAEKEEVNKGSQNGISPKYEVVETPEENVEAETQAVDKEKEEEYVEVEKEDADKGNDDGQ